MQSTAYLGAKHLWGRAHQEDNLISDTYATLVHNSTQPHEMVKH